MAGAVAIAIAAGACGAGDTRLDPGDLEARDQRAALAQHPFDLADYLLFVTRWEDALGYGK